MILLGRELLPSQVIHSHILPKDTMQDQQGKDKGKGKGKFTMQLNTRFIMTCNPKRNTESVLSKFRSISDRYGFDVVMEYIRCETERVSE